MIAFAAKGRDKRGAGIPVVGGVAPALARPGRLAAMLLLAGPALLTPGPTASAAGRAVILDYLCATYESARLVALSRAWDHPETLPGDCRTLFRRDMGERLASIIEIIEIIPMGNGRWLQIGKVDQELFGTGYSSGIATELRMF